MDTETTEDRIDRLAADHPERTYEITWASGRREKLAATQVQMPRDDFMGRSDGMVRFYGPLDREDGMGRCGRLLLVAQLGQTGIVRIRDLGVDFVEVWTVAVKARETSFWRRFLDAITFGMTRKDRP